MPLPLYIIIDGNSLLHRAWHAIPELTAPDGTVVNAVYGFVNVLEKLITDYHPDYLSVAWDLPGKTFRHEEYQEYKATREKKSPDLYNQIPLIQELLSAYHIPSLSAVGFEGDDILGTIATLNQPQNLRTLIFTGDLDSLQLVDNQTSVAVFIKGLSEVKIYDRAAVLDRYGLAPEQLIDYKALIGDPSDNLPGIAGVGAKTASVALQKYGTATVLWQAVADGLVPAALDKKLLGHETEFQQFQRLVTIVKDVPLPGYKLDHAQCTPPNLVQLKTLFTKWQFNSWLRKYAPLFAKLDQLSSSITPSTTPSIIPSTTPSSTPSTTPLIASRPTAWYAFTGPIAIILNSPTHQSVGEQTETPDLTITIATTRESVIIPWLEFVNSPNLFSWLTTHPKIIGLDLIALWRALANEDPSFKENFATLATPVWQDLHLIAYLLDPSERTPTLAHLYSVHAPALVATDARTIFPLALKMMEHLRTANMALLLTEIEAPLMSILWKMEVAGILVDQNYLKDLSLTFNQALTELTTKITALAGEEFNLNSPSQLATILFHRLALPTKGIKKTKTGLSTAASELEKLKDTHPIVELISEYREVAKLSNTYVESLPESIGQDGRIHSQFNQTVAATGRLSSSDPNLQNIPVKTPLGLKIRHAFIAKPGFQFLSADYSQIELRLAAHLANDQPFIQAFNEGADIHTRAAAEIWNIPEASVTKEQRYTGKIINFSLLYGIGVRSLARSIGCTNDEAKTYLERFFQAHPAITAYMAHQKSLAKSQGFVTTMLARRRPLPEINSPFPQFRAAAERIAVNSPIQGTQADILKQAMILIDHYLVSTNSSAKLLLQIHDELIFEVRADELESLRAEVIKLMIGVIKLSVPLVVDTASGERWDLL